LRFGLFSYCLCCFLGSEAANTASSPVDCKLPRGQQGLYARLHAAFALKELRWLHTIVKIIIWNVDASRVATNFLHGASTMHCQ
jgi:hypothetical protein